MVTYLSYLEKQFKHQADPVKAAGAKAYLLNQFEFYGLSVPHARKLSRDFIKANEIPTIKEVERIVKASWMLPQREWQYFAIELLSFYKKQWKASTIKLIEFGITHKSWWDTVDTISDTWAGEYFKLFPGQVKTVTAKWNQNNNIWLQRSSLLFQKKYKQQTDTQLLAEYIQHLSSSKEFFIRKAIGWILREYAKTNPVWVKRFVVQNPLSPLSKREALKHF